MTSPLTPRQLEICQLLWLHGNRKTVAHHFGLSIRTVDFHLMKAANRTKTSGDVHLMRWLLERDLIKVKFADCALKGLHLVKAMGDRLTA